MSEMLKGLVFAGFAFFKKLSMDRGTAVHPKWSGEEDISVVVGVWC
jgi:hypothetical protein